MDSIYEYIGLFVILFSILQSILNKKKKEQEEARKKQGASVRRTQSGDAAGSGGTDYIEELEQIRAEKQKERHSFEEPERTLGYSAPEAYTGTRQDEQTDTWYPEQDFGYQDTSERIKKEETRLEAMHREKYGTADLKDEIDTLPEEVKKLEVKLPDKEELSVIEEKRLQRVQEIKKKLADPRTLKDYIIMKEILDEPKALRN